MPLRPDERPDLEYYPDVICDACSADWSSNPTTGGCIVLSFAWCPTCAADPARDLQRLKTVQWCPRGVSFADFVRDARRRRARLKGEL